MIWDQQAEKGWNKALAWRVQQEGHLCIIHSLLLSLFSVIILTHVVGAQQGKRHVAASSYPLRGSTGNQDAPLSCPATGKRSQIQVALPASRHLKKHLQSKVGQTLGQSSEPGETPISAKVMSSLISVAVALGEVWPEGLQRSPRLQLWWCPKSVIWWFWYEQQHFAVQRT